MRKPAFLLTAFLSMVLGLSFTQVIAQTSGVRAVVVNEFANIRIVPAIGADVITTVSAGYLFEHVTGRSPDNEWLRIDFNGNEGWVHVAPLTILSGDINTLPVADPRSIPYGGFESPRAGPSSATSSIFGTLPTTGVHVRAGPSTGYPRLAEAFRFDVFPVTGRTANSGWLQINYEGTLGWVTSQFVQVDTALANLPIDGVVADAPPMSAATAENYVATLRFLLERLDLAQPSLDEIRARWTDSALTGRASCQRYPPRPSDAHIANDLLAVFYPTLYPILVEFNDAMFNLRKAIDLFIEACNQPGTGNPVGQATVIGALQTIGLADKQFANLRRRISELIPPDREIGENECLFTFQNRSDILPIIQINQLVLDSFTPRRQATGYCLDIAAGGTTLLFETLQRPGSNIVHQMSVSPFDNPTNFVAVGRGTTDGRLLLGPVLFNDPGRYLIVLSNISGLDEPPQGEFGLLVTIATGFTGSQLFVDANNNNIIIGTPQVGAGQLPPFAQTPGQFQQQGQTGPQLPPTNVPGQQGFNNTSPISPVTSAVCTNITATCEQIASCEEAYACLAAGNFALDPDEDGIPCEIVRCPSG